MLLALSNGEPFATGATTYDYNSLPGSDTSARLILQIWVEGQKTSAILDTGAPFLVCSPDLARLIEFDTVASLWGDENVRNCALEDDPVLVPYQLACPILLAILRVGTKMGSSARSLFRAIFITPA
jgi:hypothetical protein